MRSLLLLFFLSSCLAAPLSSMAQKPFVEGMISYKIQIESAEGKVFYGTYTFTFKNGHIRKDLKLNSGYEDVVIINTALGTAYSLQASNGKKYAIQLSMDELSNKQKKYIGFNLKEDKTTGKIIAGYTVFKGQVTYKDGNACEIYYTPEWCPDKTLTFERFPDARFMPLSFTYTDEKGVTMRMEAEKVSAMPVENSVFRLPADCKIISYNEYKQMRK